MANFTSVYLSDISAPSSSVAFDDSSEYACSICLEPFSSDDPATITCCKHEYHLHCIIEWSQRSKECPICWQLLILKDPASQELLTAVEAGKCSRSRNVDSYAFTHSRSILERVKDDLHLVAAARRACNVTSWRRRRRQSYPGSCSSEFLVSMSSVHASGMQPTHTTLPYGGSSPTYGVPSKPSQPHPESSRKLNTSAASAKSRLFAASARYKELISKSARVLKEKLIARNVSIKELSKGVQREMNARIAGVARMVERLDHILKRSTPTLLPFCTVKGKSIQENGVGKFPSEEVGVWVPNVSSSDAASLSSSLVTGGVEISPSYVQSGHDAVKT